MKLGDKNCYPIVVEENNKQLSFELGLTFRERLIVAAMSNPSFVVFESEGRINYSRTVQRMRAVVDEQIKQIEEQK